MHDPRSQEEKARAALKRNQEMGHAPKQSPLTREPSTTPDTFGEHHGRPPEDYAPQDSPGAPGSDNDPDQHGHGHADTRMGHEHVSDLSDAERVVTGEPAQKKR
ncbi:hypothetical protein [Salinarimonas ramus]|uniref:Uncharacterized protein n=1 Tax=Salinarimonas ramus TaxID=690164 RepID=A0A917Q8Q5_9HYPH|nr:hypothetical protein [Salinarimonas ramus]GGK35795.1 hypothetical protein GCM10011322_23420 [Salinarimonas ramus]